MYFPFPVGLLLFNSPEYSEKVLNSLKNQTLEIDESRLIIRIDGFSNSKPESLGDENLTSEVFNIASNYFSKAKIIRNEVNKGIAQQYWYLAEELYAMPNSDWALFFEHDFILNAGYFESILKLIKKVENFPEIVQVDATGDTLSRLIRGLEHYYIPEHDWAFALKKEHHFQRYELLKDYITLISKFHYFSRDSNQIYQLLNNLEIYPMGSSIDYVSQAIRRKFKKLSVTTGAHFGKYIGEIGEDYTPDIFKQQGYGNWVLTGTSIDNYPDIDQTTVETLKIEDYIALNKSAHEIIKFFELEYFRIVNQYKVQNDNFEKEVLFLHEELNKSHQTNLKIMNSKTYKMIRFLSKRIQLFRFY